ncbi:MAG: fibronectin type III domain-containing protein, partial [Chloroflexi bacterium]|nr:fibronectin type III domain-containing protein [Chloroflexota bacterium]
MPNGWPAGRMLGRRAGLGAWPAQRVGLAAVVGGLLLSAVLLGHVAPLLAQEGVGIAFDDLTSQPTHTTVHRFGVELSNLDAATTYAVVVASDNATALGIGACGTAAQAQTVTGVTAQDLAIVVYACALGSGTLTAEVRAAGAATAAATVSRALTVLAIPEGAPPGVPGAAPASAATRGATKAGTPGIVPNVRFDNVTSTSARARWDKPSNGGRTLTGFGLLMWTGPDHPNYGDAFVVGKDSRSHTYTGLQAGATYKFRIHACNDTDSCGHWT